MFLNFAKINPNGNMTILVLDPVARDRQSGIAERLMACNGVHAEQVGFLEKPTLSDAQVRLQMMGGEFCGNATLSMAAWLAHTRELPVGARESYALEVSGAQGVLDCDMERISSCRFRGSVPMPLPEEVFEAEILPGTMAPLVRFPGIVHAILPEGCMDNARAQTMIPDLCARLDTDAMGLLFVDDDFNRIRPLVYVRKTASCVWESGCGSGTAALGAWCAAILGGEADLNVRQPSGSGIGVRARWEAGRVTGLAIRGEARIVATGEAWMDD